MDKYTGYVLVVYAVTFVMLAGYLIWMWLRLQKVRHVTPLGPLEGTAKSTARVAHASMGSEGAQR